jgi:hypothetical protein
MENQLKLLNCPFSISLSELDSLEIQCKIFAWLEDRIIRNYEIDEREKLRQPTSVWIESINIYLNSLSCPFVWTKQDSRFPPSNRLCLQWLIQHAASLDYEDAFLSEAMEVENSMENGESTNLNAVSSHSNDVAMDSEKLLELGRFIGLSDDDYHQSAPGKKSKIYFAVK